jgi:hypothetical protein
MEVMWLSRMVIWGYSTISSPRNSRRAVIVVVIFTAKDIAKEMS